MTFDFHPIWKNIKHFHILFLQFYEHKNAHLQRKLRNYRFVTSSGRNYMIPWWRKPGYVSGALERHPVRLTDHRHPTCQHWGSNRTGSFLGRASPHYGKPKVRVRIVVGTGHFVEDCQVSVPVQGESPLKQSWVKLWLDGFENLQNLSNL